MAGKRVLHITAHLGGGVGRFYRNVLGSDAVFDHHYALLEEPIDKALLPADGKWFVVTDWAEAMEEVRKADVVQIEFWNHPLLYQFIAQLSSWPPCRLVLYAHVSCLFPPAYLPPAVSRMVDHLMLSTHAATSSDAARDRHMDYTVIPEFGGAERTIHLERKGHEGFRVLYVGTADALKIHPNLLEWCVELHAMDPEISFTFCTQDSSACLRNQVPESSASAFEFLEGVSDLSDIMSTSDVFGYALHPRHYGTGEQALLEAMGAEVVPVVLDNPAERFIVQHGVTGIIARGGREYKESVLFLKRHREIRRAMGEAGRKYVRESMSAEVTQNSFHSVYRDVIENTPKRTHELGVSESSPWSLFLLSQGPDAAIFEGAADGGETGWGVFARWQMGLMSNQRSKSKGTVCHWGRVFPEDNCLSRIQNLLENS